MSSSRRPIPVACLLDEGQAQQRWRDWQALAHRLMGEERSPGRWQLRFQADENTPAELRRLVEGERECCGFVAWDLEEKEDELILTISGDPIGLAAIGELLRTDSR